jgi:hypothetical protein
MMRTYYKIAIQYTVLIILLNGCGAGDEPKPKDCNQSNLAIQLVTKSNPTSCSASDGSIEVSATGGNTPYTFNINSGTFGSAATFTSLGAGTFTVKVKDKNGCEKSIDVQLSLSGVNTLSATLTITADTECVGGNGAIQVNAAGGAGSYQYKLNEGAFGVNATFASLDAGGYSISVKDAENCIFTIGATVAKGDTQTSLATHIKPIVDTKCAISGCHNGTQSPDLRSNTNIISNASTIKSLTQSGAMPKTGSLSNSEKALIACWVDEGARNN